MPIATRQHHRAIAFRLAITERVRTFLAPGCWLLDLHRFLDEIGFCAALVTKGTCLRTLFALDLWL